MSVEQVQEDHPEYDEDLECFPCDPMVDVTYDPMVDALTSTFLEDLGEVFHSALKVITKIVKTTLLKKMNKIKYKYSYF